MTDKQRRWYEDALNAYASGNGQRWNGNLAGKLTTAAAACGLSADEVINDAAARMPNFSATHAAKIRTDMATAARRQGTTFRDGSGFRPRRQQEPQGCPDFVRGLIAAGGGTATSGDLLDLSPIPVRQYAKDGRAATVLFLRTLWRPSDLLHVFSNSDNLTGKIGRNLRTRDEWLDLLQSSPLPGDCIKKNPFTGQPYEKNGKASLVYDECVAEYRYALIEFDALPLREQCAFWRGFLASRNLAPTLASLTFSGGKSLHGLIRTNADAVTASTVRASLMRLFCADPTTRTQTDTAGVITTCYPYRADAATLGKGGGTRIAGARRIEGIERGDPKKHGRMQTLIYLADGSRMPTPQPIPLHLPVKCNEDKMPIITADKRQQPQLNTKRSNTPAKPNAEREHNRDMGSPFDKYGYKAAHGPSAADFAQFTIMNNGTERDCGNGSKSNVADETPTEIKHERPATTEATPTFTFSCHDCPTAEDCKHAFGKFWLDRSHGGVGCRQPFKGWKTRPHPILL